MISLSKYLSQVVLFYIRNILKLKLILKQVYSRLSTRTPPMCDVPNSACPLPSETWGNEKKDAGQKSQIIGILCKDQKVKSAQSLQRM